VKKAFPKSGVVEVRKPTRGAILKGHGPVDGAGPTIEFVGEAPEIIMTKTLRPGRVGIWCHLSLDQSDDEGEVQQIWRTFFVRADGWRNRKRKRFRYEGGTGATLR
jgi:hypothetical protein